MGNITDFLDKFKREDEDKVVKKFPKVDEANKDKNNAVKEREERPHIKKDVEAKVTIYDDPLMEEAYKMEVARRRVNENGNRETDVPTVGQKKLDSKVTSREPLYEDKHEVKTTGFLGNAYSRYILPPKKEIIILAIEDNSKVREYKEMVSKIISKIIEDNKEAFFLIFRMGFRPKCYGTVSYEIIQKNRIQEKLLEETEEADEQCLLYEVLKYIKHNINSIKTQFNKIDVEGKKYEITGCKIVFLGTANFESTTNELSSEILKELKSNKTIKSIKYFCIDDKDTLNAAMIGFPIIGHIESNFYK